MTVTTALRSDVAAAEVADWCYASGQVAARETELLPASVFETLAGSDPTAARVALGRSRYRVLFTSEQAVRGYLASLAQHAHGVLAELRAASPPHVMWEILDLPRRYGTVRAAFLRRARNGSSPEELARTLASLDARPPQETALGLHTARLWEWDSPQRAGAVAGSVFLDSAACALGLALARTAAGLAGCVLVDLAVLRCWAVLARHCWNGTSPVLIRRWFVLPDEERRLRERTLAECEADPAAALSGKLSAAAFEALLALGAERIRRDLDLALWCALTASAAACREVAFGPERVLWYLLAFDTEQANLRLVLASVVEGIAASEVRPRLRRAPC